MSAYQQHEEVKMTPIKTKVKNIEAPKISGNSNTSTTNSDQNNEEVIVTEQPKNYIEKKPKSTIPFDEIFDDDYLFELLLDYFDLNDIYLTFYPLNSKYQNKVEESNYLLLGKLTDKLNITQTYLSSDIPCYKRIVDLYKSAVRTIQNEKPVDLKPNPFSTDSGLVGTNMWYGMHNIFQANNSMYSYYVFSSNKGEKNHVQTYLCCPGTYDNNFSQKLKSQYEEEPGSKNIYVPYEKTLPDGSAPTFKIPKVFEINCRNQGY